MLLADTSSPPFASADTVFLTADELAAMLKIPVKTVYQLANEKTIPGMRYGKHWRFLLSDVINWHRENAMAMPGKEDLIHGHQATNQGRSLVCGYQLPGREREVEEIHPYDWQNDEETGAPN
ncbi:MAG: helix-turn-helix domain-containing protein [Deltaproteobacteria bacterium]|nr:helix-turn-helix domain-containing protein [Deltaproteobacteria bacterium]